MARRITRLAWEGQIPVTKWTLFYSRVLSLLAKKQGVELQLILQSVPEGGLSEREYKAVTSALRDLDLDANIQVEEEETDEPAAADEEEPEREPAPPTDNPRQVRVKPIRASSHTPRHSRPSDAKVIPTQAEISIMPEHEVTLWQNWTALARHVDQAGRSLHERFGGDSMTTKQFKDEVTKVSHYNPSGILVTDFCYNLINEADYSFRFPVFEFLARGSYRYLGPNRPYTGPLYWRPMGGSQDLVVGRWEKGKCFLRFDPRVARAKRLA